MKFKLLLIASMLLIVIGLASCADTAEPTGACVEYDLFSWSSILRQHPYKCNDNVIESTCTGKQYYYSFHADTTCQVVGCDDQLSPDSGYDWECIYPSPLI